MSFPIITTATHEIEFSSWEYFTFEGSSKFTGLGTGTAPSLAASLPIGSHGVLRTQLMHNLDCQPLHTRIGSGIRLHIKPQLWNFFTGHL